MSYRSLISSLSLKLYLNSLVYHRNIFGSFSKVFGNLQASSEILGKCSGAVRQRYTEGAQKCQTALLQSRNLGKHPIQVVLFKDGQSVDWNCCGEITLRSELVGLIAWPINLGLLMFV